MKRTCWIVVGLVLAGCSARTRTPTLAPSHPVAERQSFELHYPYAEEDSGPQTFSQPRDYDRQRAEPTRLQRPPQPGYPVIAPPVFQGQ
jgi:hypothetical protein